MPKKLKLSIKKTPRYDVNFISPTLQVVAQMILNGISRLREISFKIKNIALNYTNI